MDESAVRQLITDHFGDAGKDEVAAAEIFADDAVIEWPQSRERIRGKPQILALHEASPVRVDIDVRRTIGCGDLWVPSQQSAMTVSAQPEPSSSWSSAMERWCARRTTSVNRSSRPRTAPPGSS